MIVDNLSTYITMLGIAKSDRVVENGKSVIVRNENAVEFLAFPKT